ncbi:KilA-N domain-containing protein [Serratia ureilytica]|uniref:KilA-N domain-containing protein n=1 Tax=Serratia ureilytica TaxID=300181 RepID=A0A9X9C076_9GAMM|nr:KilA-N domain-containing protein [Serratia ureilytica]TXE25875.1 KilA-N domain-containing protein [Serratia ureilytica]
MSNVANKSLPVIAGVLISTDDEGRFNLNALHKASGLGANKAPAQWLRTNAAQELVQEVTDMQICTSPIHSIKGGPNQGTFAHELLAVEYAGWISPAFRLKFEAHSGGLLCYSLGINVYFWTS